MSVPERLSRSALLLGTEALEKLKNSRVAVFGIGGVGGYTVEALARTGVGHIDLIDPDKVCESNINRQILALSSTVGMYKTDVAEKRVLDINPECTVTKHNVFFLPGCDFCFDGIDFVVDAIDTVKGKLALAEETAKRGIPFISSMGAGNKLDPTKFEVCDIFKTSVDPLAKVMRAECRKRGIPGFKVVYSKEPPVGSYASNNDVAGRKTVPGSVAFVPSAVGLIIAGEVIKEIINREDRVL